MHCDANTVFFKCIYEDSLITRRNDSDMMVSDFFKKQNPQLSTALFLLPKDGQRRRKKQTEILKVAALVPPLKTHGRISGGCASSL